jgi:hypothetical protein
MQRHISENISLQNQPLPKIFAVKGAYMAGIKVCNHRPQSIKTLVDNETSFKVSLKRFLYRHSSYSMQEYYQHMENK